MTRFLMAAGWNEDEGAGCWRMFAPCPVRRMVLPGGGSNGSRGGSDGDGGDGRDGSASGGSPPSAPPSATEHREPPAPRRPRLLKWLLWLVLAAALLCVLLVGALAAAVCTERGTSLTWRAGVALLHGRLGGTLEGGTLANGVRVKDLAWTSPNGAGFELHIDRLSGRWALARAPWHLTIDTLNAGTIDLKLPPSTPSKEPTKLPADLRLPLALTIGSLSFDQLRLHEPTSTTVLEHLRLHGASDGRHHALTLERLDTPYGALQAQARLDGVRPFPLDGTLGYKGQFDKAPASAQAQLSGSLEALGIDLDASGAKLTGHGHIDAAPFAAVPLTRATLNFDHVDPAALAPGAPHADLSLRAELKPVTGTPGVFKVGGPVSIVNAKPGLYTAGALPLIDAVANLQADAHTQRIDGLKLRLVQGASLSGGGQLQDGRGRFDFALANLDPHVFTTALRPLALSGPLTVALAEGKQTVALTLADRARAHTLEAHVTSTPQQTAIDTVRLGSGAGRLELKGVLKHDARAAFNLDTRLTNFDPLAWAAAQGGKPAAPRGASAAAASQSAAAAKSVSAQAKSVAAQSQHASEAQAVAAQQASGAKTPTQKTAAQGASMQGAPAPSGTAQAHNSAPQSAAAATPAPATRRAADLAPRPGTANVNGTLNASGTLADRAVLVRFTLGDSTYDGLPMTGAGRLQLAGTRILPSTAKLAVAGNDIALDGSFGAPGDRLTFAVDAPQLGRLGFGVAGVLDAHGQLSGTFEHPDIVADYRAHGVAFGANRIGTAQGQAQIRDGQNGALAATLDAADVALGPTTLQTLSLRLAGTRAHHTLQLQSRGTYQGQALDLALAANGGLREGPGGTRWDGTLTRLDNQGLLAFALDAPLSISAGAQRITLGATRLSMAGATLDLKRFDFAHGAISSAGSLSNLQLARLMAIRAALGAPGGNLQTDLVLNGRWDVTLGATASGFVEFARESGDARLETGRSSTALGLSALAARASFGAGNRLHLTAQARASRIGSFDADLLVPFALRDGVFGLAEQGALGGTINADVPSLRTTGLLLGPNYLLDGRVSLKLAVAGTPAKPKLSGMLSGDGLSATLVDLGVQLKDGVMRVALADNLVDFQQVEFHGAQGTLRMLGRVRLDGDQPDLTASVVADKLELFAAPDRQLSLSGSAKIENDGARGGIGIDGKFTIDHALFDLPEQSAPHLSDDVVVVGPDSIQRGTTKTDTAAGKAGPAAGQSASPLAPHANIEINLGHDFRFKAQGADLGLLGAITITSAPGAPLRAVGNVHVTNGSTYTAFGTKLAIENGFFTFNGPVTNPGVNILAMRRNQEVEAGVQVTGTPNALTAKLVSEPNVPDNEKLSWLLFGHGTDQGSNLNQQNAMASALALLGNTQSKRVAQTLGLDEVSIGQSDVGLTDSQVVLVSKAINKYFVLGYEQGLQSAGNAFKLTLNLTRFWSVLVYGGTYDGVDLSYTRRFDHW